MLEKVTIRAATTDNRLAYQYTDALSLPSSNSLIQPRIRSSLDHRLRPKLGQ